MKQLALEFPRARPRTFASFVAGRNAELLHGLERLAAGQGERFLYVWGAPGSGRSHLLAATVAAFGERGAAAALVDCSTGLAADEALRRLHGVALDDVDRLDAAGQVAAFDLYNALRERGGALVAAGAAPPVQLALREDLVTRLAWGLVYQVHALSDDEKARALADHAAARGFLLEPAVSDYLLARASRDLPSLLGMLDALDRYSLETKRPVTVPLARELLSAERRGPTGGA